MTTLPLQDGTAEVRPRKISRKATGVDAVFVHTIRAVFLASQGTPGVIVEHGDTSAMFQSPQDPRTSDDVHGRFG